MLFLVQFSSRYREKSNKMDPDQSSQRVHNKLKHDLREQMHEAHTVKIPLELNQ